MVEFALPHLDSSFLPLPTLKWHSSSKSISSLHVPAPWWKLVLLSLFEAQILKVISLQGLEKEEFCPLLFLTPGIKRSFCVSALNGKARPLGFLFFRASSQQSTSGLERRGHLCLCVWKESSLFTPGNLWAPAGWKVRIDFFSSSC